MPTRPQLWVWLVLLYKNPILGEMQSTQVKTARTCGIQEVSTKLDHNTSKSSIPLEPSSQQQYAKAGHHAQCLWLLIA